MKPYTLPLFPLNVVVCPGGLLPLRIFEARYLDMVHTCLRNKSLDFARFSRRLLNSIRHYDMSIKTGEVQKLQLAEVKNLRSNQLFHFTKPSSH
jgi:hypothetical protein